MSAGRLWRSLAAPVCCGRDDGRAKRTPRTRGGLSREPSAARPRGARSTGGPKRRIMARILIAEDDDSMRAFLARALRRAGHWVESAADGLDAIEVLTQQEFDLLLADVVMPGLDGVELARRANNRAEHTSELQSLMPPSYSEFTL